MEFVTTAYDMSETPVAKIRLDVPDNWFYLRNAVPNLINPIELVAVASEPLAPVPADSQQNRPMAQHLNSTAVLVWLYAQRQGDPAPSEDEPICRFEKSADSVLTLDDAATFGDHNAREWSAERFAWRRTGMSVDSRTNVTAMIWEGKAASRSTLRAADRLLRSLEVYPALST